jgi:IS30 family transposase
MTKKSNGAPLKTGSLTDQEKRDIERWIDVKNYAEIARLLNRNPATIRKYCQRNGLSNDIVSKKKYTDNRAKHNHHLVAMREQLSKSEYEFAVQIYKGMMEQAGTDIVYSEEVQIIEYCTITCLLNRVLKREMDIASEVEVHKKQRAEWQKKKDELSNTPAKDDEDEEAEKYDMEEYYMDKIEQISLSIADLQVEYVQVKRDQKDFLDRKESITKALNGSREQRAKEITRVNQNFSDLIVFIKKNEDFRNTIGAEIEKMRLGIKEEYIRLSDLHVFGDGIEDYPVYNTEVVMRENA